MRSSELEGSECRIKARARERGVTALHCVVLHFPALHCTARPCTALHCTTLRDRRGINMRVVPEGPTGARPILLMFCSILYYEETNHRMAQHR